MYHHTMQFVFESHAIAIRIFFDPFYADVDIAFYWVWMFLVPKGDNICQRIMIQMFLIERKQILIVTKNILHKLDLPRMGRHNSFEPFSNLDFFLQIERRKF